jgi:AraC-like DNA-binding protein
MEHQHYTTFQERPDRRAQLWSSINENYFGRLKVACLDTGPLDAQLDAYEAGSLRLLTIAAPAHRVIRDRECGELPTDEMYKLVLQLAGRAEISIGGRSFDLRAGDWSLYDPRVPYSITNFERSSLLVVQVPRQQLRGFKVPNLHTCEARGSGALGLYAVFGGFLRSLSEQLPSLPDGAGPPVSESLLGLLASTLTAYQEEGPDPQTLPSVLKLRVLQYVQTHLAEPDLSIDRIARDLRCSKRYLHRVFEGDDMSLERRIWQTRLERCAEGLRAQPSRPVSDIAFSWGFSSSAHFSRLFKSRYGVSPREYRAARLPH